MTYEKRTVTNEDKTQILDKLKGARFVKRYFDKGGSIWYPNIQNGNFLISGQPHHGPESHYPFYFYFDGETYEIEGLSVISGVRKLLLHKKSNISLSERFRIELKEAFKVTEYHGISGIKQIIQDVNILYCQRN